jgi:hypothetical protein
VVDSQNEAAHNGIQRGRKRIKAITYIQNKNADVKVKAV